MDYKEPKTRQEKKGRKYKDIYNKKTVRIYENIMNKNNENPTHQKNKNKK